MISTTSENFAYTRTTPFRSSSLPTSQHAHNNSFVSTRLQVRPLSAPRAVTPSEPLSHDVGSRFGARLREFRMARNITQLRMAVDFGIDRSFISDVERGRKSISLRMLEVIALGMNVSLSELLAGL